MSRDPSDPGSEGPGEVVNQSETTDTIVTTKESRSVFVADLLFDRLRELESQLEEQVFLHFRTERQLLDLQTACLEEGRQFRDVRARCGLFGGPHGGDDRLHEPGCSGLDHLGRMNIGQVALQVLGHEGGTKLRRDAGSVRGDKEFDLGPGVLTTGLGVNLTHLSFPVCLGTSFLITPERLGCCGGPVGLAP